MSAEFRRPVNPGQEFFDEIEGGSDPADLIEAADRAAHLLVRGRGESDRAELAERIARLGDGDGLNLIASMWSQANPLSLSGALWRLYLLRAFVQREPHRAAREFAAGLPYAEVSGAVAGVAEPPGPEQVAASIEQVLMGIATSDFADVLFRAAAFAKVVATGRAARGEEDPESAAKLQLLAEQLEKAGRRELAHTLH